jgi:hypothetical protein
MVVRVLLRPVNMTSVCRSSHQIVRAKRWFVSDDNSGSRIAHDFLATPILSSPSRRLPLIVHHNDSASFRSLTLAPVRSLVLVEATESLADVISSA